MDLKTLEYMEERAKKARKLVNRIETLTINLNRIALTEKINFLSWKGCFQIEFDEKNQKDLLVSIVKETAGAFNKEIEKLEKELAEL